MNFEDYTRLLAAAGVITRGKANKIIEEMRKQEHRRMEIEKEFDNRFWDEELRYGSGD